MSKNSFIQFYSHYIRPRPAASRNRTNADGAHRFPRKTLNDMWIRPLLLEFHLLANGTTQQMAHWTTDQPTQPPPQTNEFREFERITKTRWNIIGIIELWQISPTERCWIAKMRLHCWTIHWLSPWRRTVDILMERSRNLFNWRIT